MWKTDDPGCKHVGVVDGLQVGLFGGLEYGPPGSQSISDLLFRDRTLFEKIGVKLE